MRGWMQVIGGLLALLTITGCGAEDDAPRLCPAGMLFLTGGPHTLGESDASRHEGDFAETTIRSASFEVGAFCIDALPFPGLEGERWPTDGLDFDRALSFEALLAQHGRRLCTVEELLFAAAGPDNLRVPYGDERIEGQCPEGAYEPHILGATPSCISPTGARDFLVRSSWAELTLRMRGLLAAYGAPVYPTNGPPAPVPDDWRIVVYGGTADADTFYAPNNFGIHGHQPGDGVFVDDAVRVCRDPEPVDRGTEAAWDLLLGEFLASDEGDGGWIADLLGAPRERE